jgi:CheY-like chemotaxis protein
MHTKKVVLIVEDDDTIRRMVSLLFESKGWRVVATGLPAEVIERQLHLEADVIILDDSLPGISGYELASLIKPALKSSAQLVFTPSGHLDDITQFDLVIMKPVTILGLRKIASA